jgi:hypothetical protein
LPLRCHLLDVPAKPKAKRTVTLQAVIKATHEFLNEKAAATPGTMSVWRSTERYNLPFIKKRRQSGRQNE